jgi:pimeloyl-ACP methyl ester carboxylesterase
LIMALSPPSPRQVEKFASKIGGENLSQLLELRDLLVAAQKLPGAQESTLGLLHAVVQLRGARQEVRLSREQLGQIRHPVLLIWGSRDAFGGPSVAEEAAQAIPDGEICIVPEAGHVPWVGNPGDVIAAAIPFLRRHTA